MTPVFYLLGLLVLILLQTTLLNHATIVGIKPDLALIGVYFVGLFGGEARGVWVGLGLGYLMDLMSGGGWGIHLTTKPTLGFFAGLLGRTLVNVRAAFTGLIIAFCSIIQGLIFLLVSFFISDPENLSVFVYQIILPQAIYDGVVGSGLFWILSRSFQPKQTMALGWYRNPALSRLGKGKEPAWQTQSPLQASSSGGEDGTHQEENHDRNPQPRLF